MLKVLIIRIVRVLAIVALILSIPAYAFYTHTTKNPQIFAVTTYTSADETYYYEQINFVYATYFRIPLALEIADNFLEVVYWNDEIIEEMAYVATDADFLYIVGYYDEKDGKTTLKYEGIVEYANGEKNDFIREQTFDFTLPITSNEMSSDREIPTLNE